MMRIQSLFALFSCLILQSDCSLDRVRFDPCNLCTIDGNTNATSACKVVAGIFTRPKLEAGYNLVTQIPRGACYLNISEIRKSPNHLALRRKGSRFILNGNRKLSQTGSYEGAGAIFNYLRQNLTTSEAITSRGPMLEPVELLVLYQQHPNPGVKYEYQLPPPSSHFFKKQWAISIAPVKQGREEHLNQNFPAGKNTRPWIYAEQDSLQNVSTHNNNTDNKIHRHLVSIISEKPVSPLKLPHKNIYYWKIIGYTNCSQPCGDYGVQRSIIRCVRDEAGSETGTVLVSERHCSTMEKPFEHRSRCNFLKPCPAEWVIGSDWSDCEGECGEGKKTRQVFCEQRLSSNLTMRVKEEACLQQKPETMMTCVLENKCSEWTTKEWGPCSKTCGNGLKRRLVECIEGDGRCDEGTRPEQVETCNIGSCFDPRMEEEGLWMVSDWDNKCSQKCGKGVETRHVVCVKGRERNHESGYYGYTLDDGKGQINNSAIMHTILVQRDQTNNAAGPQSPLPSRQFATKSKDMCRSEEKPRMERECASKEDCKPEWFTTEWGECSRTCEMGFRTRQVLCVHLIHGKFKVLSDQHCSNEKPQTIDSCVNLKACDATWFTTDWTNCSAQCGGGFQERVVSCRIVTSNSSMESGSCSDDKRPKDRRACNEQPCKTLDSGNNDEGVVGQPSVKLSEGLSIPEEEKLEGQEVECEDEYRNCALVFQARLCRYKYYRSICCHSCHKTD